ncbi:Sec14p-like phosphatidylinositol transfer family protein [Hibiscus syriacus]|uniref:Sec14p-like phosphatidylinositol transfer family protein n=1 Tax=Hibiscus syriacus TaxID=106335 RepID=A0A6A3AGW6_HIBSY|nr:transcription factor bHLH110-like [Hibiscus syriacus]KAE8703821.1 Sec14p-like phosphatidylinositol transfer family protein [Hibiscus syriacus]
MESENLHPRELKAQELYVKYSSLVTPTSHPVSTIDEWNPNLFPNIGSKHNRDLNETMSKSRDPCFNEQSASEFLLANIKDEMSDSFPSLSETIYCHSIEHSYLPSKKHYCAQYPSDYDLGGNYLWHSNFSIANNMTELQLSSGELNSNVHHSPCPGTTLATSRHDFNHVFPSTNISTSDFCSTLLSSSLDLNLKSLDLLTSTHDGGSYNQSLLDMIPGKLSRGVFMGHESHDHRREHSDSTSTSSKVSSFVSGSITSTKRPGSFSDTMESTHTDAKKHRSSCPTLKLQVRKEKLGDRIAALQKLVAPFGKTDTSTVLTEAIGYIQFLQDQVQTLSVPFMKSSQSKHYGPKQGGSREEEGKKEHKCDLRSRGLCLVPRSLASQFINSCCSGIWTSPH